jgi:hypothetical protein
MVRTVADDSLMRRTLCAAIAVLLSSGQMSFAQSPIDIYAYFQKARDLGGDGLARKTKIVDAREATPGEVVVTVIKGRQGNAEPTR